MKGLQIYKASAGSGKTYALTREYLYLLFQDPGRFRNILAVTFTNKATAEMKSRVLLELHKLSGEGQSNLLPEIEEKFGLTDEQVKDKASFILDQILHNYSGFRIETIDSFLQRVIRSFAHELGLQAGYNLELDVGKVLEEGTDRLLYSLDRDEPLRKWLTDFAETKIREGKHWNLKRDIMTFSQELFKEKFRENSSKLIEQLDDPGFLNRYLNELYQLKNRLVTGLKELGEQGIQQISRAGLVTDDFFGKSRGPAGFIEKISAGSLPEFSPAVRNYYNNPDAWVSGKSFKRDQILHLLDEGLNDKMGEILDYWDINSPLLNSVDFVRQFLFSLGVLTRLYRHIYDYLEERVMFLLSDAPYFISEIIGENDVPFIYEKIGYYFHHYMIDEFQDTSRMQWKNFKPLLENSMAYDYVNLLVGDVKQSIYRWRNSDWEILSEQLEQEFPAEILHVHRLDENWRSLKNIVDFNSLVFSEAIELVGNSLREEGVFHSGQSDLCEKSKKAYADVIQQIPSGKDAEGGYVEVSFFQDSDESGWKEMADHKTIQDIKNLQDAGYEPGEIAILVRKSEDGKRIAQLLLQEKMTAGDEDRYSFDMVSNELLYLAGSSSVILILSVMRFMNDPDDRLNRGIMLNEYNRYLKGIQDQNIENSIFLEAGLEDPEAAFQWLPSEFRKLYNNLKQVSLNELVERTINTFGLYSVNSEIPYIHAFQDVVMEYSKTETPDVNSFLKWWDMNGSNKALSASEEQNAIRVMTIHKAKGLQFKAVIIPYCNWPLDHPVNSEILWCHTDVEPFNKLGIIPVRYSSRLTGTIFRNDYLNEKFKVHIDHLNLLYVAFTRAQESLFINAPWKGEVTLMPSTVADILETLLSRGEEGTGISENWNEEMLTWKKGDLVPLSKSGQSQVSFVYPQPDAHSGIKGKLKIRMSGTDFLDPEKERKLNYGKLMHEIFQDMEYADDLDSALAKAYGEGKITDTERADLLEMIHARLENSRVASWFSKEWKVMNEHDILVKNGRVRRPDRILLKENKVLVIDYKFGYSILEDHEKQVKTYKKLLKEMGYIDVEGLLWYVTLDKIITVN